MTTSYLTKSSYHLEILEQLRKPNISDDKKYIMKMLSTAVEDLYSHGINIYPNIIELFFINGFKRQTIYVDLVLDLKKHILEETKDNIHWVNNRSFRKSNNREKNIILCYFLFIYHDYFLKYLQEFLGKLTSNQDIHSPPQEVNKEKKEVQILEKTQMVHESEEEKMQKDHESDFIKSPQNFENVEKGYHSFDVGLFLNDDVTEQENIFDFGNNYEYEDHFDSF